MEKSGAIRDWDEFLREVQKHFGPSVYEDSLGHVSKMIQRDKVARFIAEFEELMMRTT